MSNWNRLNFSTLYWIASCFEPDIKKKERPAGIPTSPSTLTLTQCENKNDCRGVQTYFILFLEVSL
ncbi:hypothetical protein DDZ16_13645 [Marinilabilia rubra]|uniref:Uncharacterized protein n=1 Tax=Marinilabilia rubra TaxID=2162893 RepID=A0A2U2B6U0_9BACT|nr:hypothetical protein DDZ16_13645 [Marinilabilia rubra]